MHHETQVDLSRRVFDFVERRCTELADKIYLNPVTDYTCEDQLQREKALFFREMPQIFTLSCRMPTPGDFVSSDLGGVPIVVLRGEDGTARAFLNVCRHRGARLVTGCGSQKMRFVCPYHAWSYDSRGKLRHLTPSFGFPELDRAERSLIDLPCTEKDGLIWVKPSPGGSIDPDVLLSGLAPELASYGFAKYSHYETRTLTKRMNWKLIIDTFLETWHVATLHKQTVAPIFQPNVNVFDTFGDHGRLIIPRRSILRLKEQPESEWNFLRHTAVIYVVFPHTLLVWQGDHLEIWRPFPGERPDEASAEISLYTPTLADTDEERNHWDRNLELLMLTVNEEDFPVCLDIQKGFSSGAQDCVTFGRNEPALNHYHHAVRQRLGLHEISVPVAEALQASS
jgi:phenylpropionate dioxygenase-like ring-hydroxylating dioxygenase large terminal subunit